MYETVLNCISVIIFVIGLFFYKLNFRKIYYKKVALVCLGLVLIPLSSLINQYIPYFIQLVLFVGFSQFAHEYFRSGLFRRKKELHEIYVSKKKEHKHAREFLYPHLKELEKRRNHLIRETEKISKIKDELSKQAKELKEEKKRFKKEKKKFQAQEDDKE